MHELGQPLHAFDNDQIVGKQASAVKLASKRELAGHLCCASPVFGTDPGQANALNSGRAYQRRRGRYEGALGGHALGVAYCALPLTQQAPSQVLFTI